MTIYNLPKIVTSTLITTYVGFQNHTSNTNINLALINLEMEQLHLLNGLEQFHHIHQRSSNQSISIPHFELVEPKATPTVVWQGVTYPRGTWHVKSVPSISKRSHFFHHIPLSRGNQGITSTKNYKNMR
jgi:hypothetical protein